MPWGGRIRPKRKKPRIYKAPGSQFVCVGTHQFEFYSTVGRGDTMRGAWNDWWANKPKADIQLRTKSG